MEIELNELKHRVEELYGKLLLTSTDFDEFSVILKLKYNSEISTSTLKRLWGYVNDVHKPRVATLDVLARYVGCRDYADFVRCLDSEESHNSTFFQSDAVVSETLKVGDMLNVGWSPNRMLRLQYCGDSTYEVCEATNSKLLVGDRFIAGCIIKSQPLYLPYILRNGEKLSAFVAGRNTGIGILQRL